MRAGVEPFAVEGSHGEERSPNSNIWEATCAGDMSTEVNKRTQRGWNNWRKMSGVLKERYTR